MRLTSRQLRSPPLSSAQPTHALLTRPPAHADKVDITFSKLYAAGSASYPAPPWPTTWTVNKRDYTTMDSRSTIMIPGEQKGAVSYNIGACTAAVAGPAR